MDWRDSRGIVLLPIIIAIVVIAVIVLAIWYFVGSDPTVVPVSESVCECKDVFDMGNRLSQARAAEAATGNLSRTQRTTDPSAMYSESLYNTGKASNQSAVNAANRGGFAGTGQTKTDCTTHIDAPTACLKAALQTHENVHSTACLQFKADVKAGTKPGQTDYKGAQTMADYWSEDQSAYKAEADYLDRNIKRLMADPKCTNRVTVKTSAGSRKQDQDDQQQRLAGSKRRVAKYAKGIS